MVSFHHAAAHLDCPGRLINTKTYKEFSFVNANLSQNQKHPQKAREKSKETTSCSQLKLVLN